MTNRAWPMDAVAGAPLNTGRSIRQTQMSPLLAGANTGRPFGARSGVRPGTQRTLVTATSTTWTLRPHAGILDVQAASESGPYGYSVDSNVTGSVTAANGSNPRADIVYVQLNDPAESDGSTAPVLVVDYLAGTPGANPTIPSPPPRSLIIAQINMPVAGGGSPSVTFVAPYAVAAGGQGAFNTVAQMNGFLASFAPGEVTYCYETDATYRRSGSGTARWIRQGGGTLRATNASGQGVGASSLSTLGGLARQSDSNRDDFVTITGANSFALVEGEYTVMAKATLSSRPSGGSRTFLEIQYASGVLIGPRFNSWVEESVGGSVNLSVPAAGATIRAQVFQSNVSPSQSISSEVVITKTG